ncbi:MAG: hypothetical protein ACI8XM_001643, partial [Haloarculaceae archaeon]
MTDSKTRPGVLHRMEPVVVLRGCSFDDVEKARLD